MRTQRRGGLTAGLLLVFMAVAVIVVGLALDAALRV